MNNGSVNEWDMESNLCIHYIIVFPCLIKSIKTWIKELGVSQESNIWICRVHNNADKDDRR
jgi:hypothetical protein